MRYSTIVDKDERGLIKIIEAAQKFEEDRFLEGIRQRCYTAEDIQVAIDRIREYQAKLNTEARALVYFSQTFLQQYATNNNSCFETAHLLFNRIRSTLKASRAVFRTRDASPIFYSSTAWMPGSADTTNCTNIPA